MTEKKKQGMAALSPERRKEIARKGGIAASRNFQHMSEIGRKGGQAVSQDRSHMSAIGKRGGAAGANKPEPAPIMSGSPEDTPLPTGSSGSAKTTR